MNSLIRQRDVTKTLGISEKHFEDADKTDNWRSNSCSLHFHMLFTK